MTKADGFSPFGYYSVILSNCGGFSVMLPPIALFLKGLTTTRQASIPDYSS